MSKMPGTTRSYLQHGGNNHTLAFQINHSRKEMSAFDFSTQQAGKFPVPWEMELMGTKMNGLGFYILYAP